MQNQYLGEELGQSEPYGDRRVYHVPKTQRDQRKILFDKGRLHQRDKGPFWTGYMRIQLSKRIGLGVIARDAKGQIHFYASDENTYEPHDSEERFHWFHHSSFVGGDEVLWAGGEVVTDGKLEHLNRQSGHYLTGLYHMHFALVFLEANGVDLSKVTINLSDSEARISYLRASDFIGRIKPEDTDERIIYWRIFLKPKSPRQKLAAAKDLLRLGEQDAAVKAYVKKITGKTRA
jgi:hypothetical protein